MTPGVLERREHNEACGGVYNDTIELRRGQFSSSSYPTCTPLLELPRALISKEEKHEFRILLVLGPSIRFRPRGILSFIFSRLGRLYIGCRPMTRAGELQQTERPADPRHRGTGWLANGGILYSAGVEAGICGARIAPSTSASGNVVSTRPAMGCGIPR